MDPVTQGLLGGLAAQTGSRSDKLGKALLMGGLSGMAADLDVLIRSDSDPLLALEYHRHFTHSLFFAPIGALCCALIFYLLAFRARHLRFRQIYLWCLLGYTSHGLLDACTSYGTQLLWPLSNHRFAWDTISVIDPLFTLPMLFLVIAACIRANKRYVLLAAGWAGLYLGIGEIQHQRAISLGYDLAHSRNHSPLRLEAKPSFANLVVWKVIYETDQHFYVDAVKPGLTQPTLWRGTQARKLERSRDLPWLADDSVQANDIERFRWFSNGYIALDKHNPYRVVDIRYSMLPQQIDPLWGIELRVNADKTQHANYYSERDGGREAMAQLLKMILE